MKTDVFGLTINYKSWDKKQALPLYVAGNYEIDEAIVSNNRFIVMSPIGDLPTLPAMKKHIEKIQKIDDVPVAFYLKLLFCKWVVIIRLFTMFRAHCIPISHFFLEKNCHFNKF